MPERKLFPETRFGLGHGNIHSVLSAVDEETRKVVGNHYEPRAGAIPPAENIGMIGERSSVMLNQAKHISDHVGKEINVVTTDDLRSMPEGTVVSPYMNTQEEYDMLVDAGTTPWGLPPELVTDLRRKAFTNPNLEKNFQEGLEEGRVGITSPEHIVIDYSEIQSSKTHEFLRHIEEEYKAAGLGEKYTIGLMMRADQSDGGYGNLEIAAGNGRIVLTPNGDEERSSMHPDWQEALEVAQIELVKNMDLTRQNEIVVGRLVDVEDNPGMSVAIKDGEVYSLGWNGQKQNGNGKATVGTHAYTPAPGSYAEEVRARLADKSAQDLAFYLRSAAQRRGVNFEDISAMVNIDLIIPGELEREYLKYKLRGSGVDYRDILYAPEINPRWTNWTDALALINHIDKTTHTVKDYQGTARGRHVSTIDKFPFSPNGHGDIYNATEAINTSLTKDGYDGKVVVRMPGEHKAGVVIFGDKDGAQKAYQELNKFKTNNK
jgi:hypothetical protein